MQDFLSGAIFTAALVTALHFHRFWKTTRDRFFLFFSVAFALLGIERIPLTLLPIPKEHSALAYLFRLSAFLLIIIAIVDKNRRARPNDGTVSP